jgi:hypothetical protein
LAGIAKRTAGAVMLNEVDIAHYTGMANFLYQMHHGHIIVNIQGRPYLLDTGAPFSVGYEPIHIADRKFPVEQCYMGVTPSYMMEHIGMPIEGMIGTDIIKHFNVGIYANEQMIQFSQQPLVGDIVIPLKEFSGIPILGVKIGDRVLRMFLDTGAPTSYLLPACLAGFEAVGRHEDFYPLLGNFLTHVYDLDVSIGDVNCTLKFGELPEELRSLLEAGDVHGILGSEVLRHFALNLSLRDKLLKLELPRALVGLAAG